jgi:hypothetical protein
MGGADLFAQGRRPVLVRIVFEEIAEELVLGGFELADRVGLILRVGLESERGRGEELVDVDFGLYVLKRGERVLIRSCGGSCQVTPWESSRRSR